MKVLKEFVLECLGTLVQETLILSYKASVRNNVEASDDQKLKISSVFFFCEIQEIERRRVLENHRKYFEKSPKIFDKSSEKILKVCNCGNSLYVSSKYNCF